MTLSRTHKPAFTLVELMVSIFLLMLVMVGVNTVFSTTSATVGTNTAISTLNRDARAVQAVLTRDIANIAADSPAMIIKNEQIFAYRDRTDYLSDPTNTAPNSADLTGSGETNLLPAQYNFRSHRTDRFSFFTRQLLQRQTGEDGTFIANQTTSEQWIWLGHLRLPDNTAYPAPDTSFQVPGDLNPTTNPNNYFASQWTLGRMAIGLMEPSGGVINDKNGNPQTYISASSGLAPLSYNTTSSDTKWKIQESRYDLAGTSISGYTQILRTFLGPPAPASNWWIDLEGGPNSRFRGMPYANRPLTSASVSQMAPVMVPAVSQFIVEFAGDFVKQDSTGTVTDCYFDAATNALKPSGQDSEVDYFVTGVGANARRQIRWYGMPRSTAGNTTLNVGNGDVCPLRDTCRLAPGYSNILNAPIEKLAPASASPGAANNLLPNTFKATPADYNTTAGSNGGMPAAVASGFYYICAWGPGNISGTVPADSVRPKLIRIIMTLEDTTGRLPDGQTYEYVFSLP